MLVTISPCVHGGKFEQRLVIFRHITTFAMELKERGTSYLHMK